MKIALILVLFSSSVIGALGNTDKVESVSVMEGDSVTLHTGATKIQGSDSIEWRFNGTRMARIKSDSSSIEALFRGKIQLNNQTGDLKITNVRTTDSGLYKLNIKRSSGSSEMTFSVTVVISGVKSVSVKEEDSVTLRSGVNKQREDVIQWRHQNLLVAEYNIIPTYDTNKSFKLDNQTGSLTITNITTEHAGDYEVEITISSSRYTIHRSFSVNVSDELKSVTERDSATLNSGLTEIQRDVVIHWSFRKTIIAEIIKADQRFSTYDFVLDGRFRGRLKLDHQTGSLNITNIRTEDSGEYEVKISRSRFIVHKRIRVTINDELKSVTERDSATLNSGLTEIQRDVVIRWSFRKTIIAEIIKADEQFFIHDGPDGRFRGRLELDHQTGSLNITNTRITDSGEYEVEISRSSRFIVHKRIRITVNETVTVFVMEGDSVTLHTASEIPRDNAVLWFGDKSARIILLPASVDARWKNTDQNNQTGDLTIKNIRRDQSGDYRVIFMNIQTLFVRMHRKFHINITGVLNTDRDTVKSVTAGESVNLKTKKQSDEVMKWRFGPQNTVIAELKVPADRFTVYNDVLDGRFRDRLELDNDTGSLNITNTRTEHDGVYEAEIRGSGYTILKTFSVTVTDSGLSTGALHLGLSTGIVVPVVLLVFAAVVIYCCCKRSKTGTHSEVNGQNHTSNKDEETELTKPAEAAE